MNDDFDDLDRALFALPLETPPAGLREAILRATTIAPSAAHVFGRFEIALLGSIFAVAVWLVLALATDPVFARTVNSQLFALARVFADPATLLWLATGGSIAAWLSLGSLLPGTARRLWRS